MYRHTLIPTDGSPLAAMAVELGIALAKALQAKVTAVTVSPPFDSFALAADLLLDRQQYKAGRTAAAAKDVAVATEAAAAANVPCEVVHVEHDHPYRAIVDTANQKGCDVIVMASHGRGGVAALVLGSETLKVLTHSTVPVIVFRGQRPGAFFAAS